MREINLSADDLVSALLCLKPENNLCLLDSCGVSHLGSHLLMAGINPVEVYEITEEDAESTLKLLDEKLSQNNLAAILTVSYDFGLKINRIKPREKDFAQSNEPDIFLALFDCLIIHDYETGKTLLTGNEKKFDEIETALFYLIAPKNKSDSPLTGKLNASSKSTLTSNFTRESYLAAIEKVQEYIRLGDTYQTNLTQQIRVVLPENLTAEEIFLHLRKNHPAPFASFICRKNDVVISASPERFLTVQNADKVQSAKCKVQSEGEEISPALNFRLQFLDSWSLVFGLGFNFCLLPFAFCLALIADHRPPTTVQSRTISVSPIKGTRPRGATVEEDARLREELLGSEKDRAENVMIVDLLRNDIGRICEYGSVDVEKLCDLEEHPTLFHLVSTVSGFLRENVNFSDIMRATFPCGSITGAPKISTMRIIDELENAPRGLSMGAIGFVGFDKAMDFSVAIRTMVVKDGEAVFNVGGGITIDSIPAEEYEETLVKAQALMNALNADGLTTGEKHNLWYMSAEKPSEAN